MPSPAGLTGAVDAGWNATPAPVADVNRKCAREHAAAQAGIFVICNGTKPSGRWCAGIKKVVYDNGSERAATDNDQHVNMNLDKTISLARTNMRWRRLHNTDADNPVPVRREFRWRSSPPLVIQLSRNSYYYDGRWNSSPAGRYTIT